MRKVEETVSWVVYKMTLHKNPEGVNAVCEQSEWDAMELARPGYHKLLQTGITNEGEAERLARGTAGDAKARLHLTAAARQLSGVHRILSRGGR
jgi:hypothetical protein